MVRSGRVSVSYKAAPALERIGDFVMPKKATHKVVGDKGQPDMVMEFEIRDGRPECVELRITAKPDGRGLRTSDIQWIGIDAMKTGVYAQVAMHSSFDPETGTTRMTQVTDERELWRVINDVDKAVKAPKRGITPAELEQVAKVYRENVHGSPVKAVQVSLGYSSERTAARRVEQAREAGLLPATTPGKRKA